MPFPAARPTRASCAPVGALPGAAPPELGREEHLGHQLSLGDRRGELEMKQELKKMNHPEHCLAQTKPLLIFCKEFSLSWKDFKEFSHICDFLPQ